MAQLKSLIVNGASRFIGDVFANTFTGNLSGNADTATSAINAGTADALTGYTIKNMTSKAALGWADNATDAKILPTNNVLAYWNGAYLGTSSNLTYCVQGTIIGSNNIGSQSVNYAGTAGSATNATYTTYLGTSSANYSYDTISSALASKADRIESTVGSSTLPIYLNNGVPTAINATNVAISITGNAGSATKATQDGNGKVISDTYATKEALTNGLASKSDSTHTHSYAGSSSAGGAATSANKLNTNAGNSKLPVYFSDGLPVAIDSTDVAISITGNAVTSSACTGNANTATSAEQATKDGSGNVIVDTYFPKTGGVLAQNNPWLAPAQLQLLRDGETAYTDRGCIGVTNGNLHIDAYSGSGIYLNHYCPTGNVFFNGGTYYINGGYYNGTSAIANATKGILTFGTKTFNGSSSVTIAPEDIGMNFVTNASTAPSVTLALGTVTELTSTAITSITVALPSAPTTNVGKTQEAILRFVTSSTAPTVTFPSGIRWAGGNAPTIEASTYYEVSFVYVLGGWNAVVQSFKTA